MNLDGSAVLSGTPEQVWSVITDPAVLARTIPGCETLQQVGEDSYTMVVSAGVGAVRGKYSGEACSTAEPSRFTQELLSCGRTPPSAPHRGTAPGRTARWGRSASR